MSQVVIMDGNGNLTTAALVQNTGQQLMIDSLPVTMASNQTAISVQDTTPDFLTTASITAAGVVGTVSAGAFKADSQGSYTCIIQILGTFVGTLSFYQTIDGTNFNLITGQSVAGGAGFSSVTTPGEWIFNSGGFKEIWVAATAWTSGTANCSINSSIAQNTVKSITAGAGAVGSVPLNPPVSVSGVDQGGLKRHFALDTTGAALLSQNQSISVFNGQVVAPATNFNITAAGSGAANSATAKITPGGLYFFTVSLPATAAAALSMASCSTTLGSAVVTYTGTSPQIGSLVAGTGVAPGSYVTAVSAGVSFTMSLPAIATGGPLTFTSTGGFFQVEFEGSADGSIWSAVTAYPKTVTSLQSQVSFTNTIGLYVCEPSASINFLRARLSSLTTITTVQLSVEAYSVNRCPRIPFISGVAANVPVNTAIIPPIETSDLAEIDFDFSVVTGATITWKQAADPFLATSQAITALTVNATPNTSVVSVTAAGVYRVIPRSQYFFAQNTTVGTTFAIAGASSIIGQRSAQDGISIGSLPTLASVTTVTTVSTVTAIVGGNIASAAADTINKPLVIGGADFGTSGTTTGLIRRSLTDAAGNMFAVGAGDFSSNFQLSTGGASVTDGTNGKTFFVRPIDSDIYLDLTLGGGTTPTFQLEGSYDNATFFIIPLTRYDNTAASLQYASIAAFTPVTGARYRGKTYGVPILRVHLVSGTTPTASGTIRVTPSQDTQDVLISPFNFTTATGTVEAVGSPNGQVFTGNLRTLVIPNRGSSKAILHLETIGSGVTVALEGSMDNGASWTAIPMQTEAGSSNGSGAISTVTSVTTAGKWQADLGAYSAVRARCTAWTSGNTFGYLKIVSTSSRAVALTSSSISTFTSATTASILAANSYRKLATIQNEPTSAGILYVGLNLPSVTTAAYSVLVNPGDFLPITGVVGQISGGFLGSTGTARVNESI